MNIMKSYISYCLLIVLSAITIYSCSDDIEYVKPLPEMNIDLGTINEVYYFNDNLVIEPQITLGENVESATHDFSFEWSLVGENNIEVISQENILNYTLDSIGTINLLLEVTDNNTNIIKSSINTIEVVMNGTTNQGWYVLKETLEGKTDIDGFYLIAKNPDYNIVERLFGESLEGAPVSFAFSDRYHYRGIDPYEWQYPAALMAFSKNDGIVFNIANQYDDRVLAGLEDMFFLDPSQSEHTVNSGLVCNNKVVISMDDGCYAMNSGNPAFFPAMEGDYTVETSFVSKGSYYPTFTYDSKNERFIAFVNDYSSQADTLVVFKDEYDSYYNNGLQISANNMNGQVIFMENTLHGSGWSADTYAYSLFKENGVDNSLILYGLDYDNLVGSTYGTYKVGNFSPINFMRRIDAATYPMIVDADEYTLNKANNVLYFAKGNVVGAYNVDYDEYNESLITDIPSNENVTFIKHIKTDYETTDVNFNGLVVATYNSINDTYKIYRYQFNGLNSLILQDEVLTGQGKAEKILYVSPSTYYWPSDLYLYN